MGMTTPHDVNARAVATQINFRRNNLMARAMAAAVQPGIGERGQRDGNNGNEESDLQFEHDNSLWTEAKHTLSKYVPTPSK